MSRQKVRIVRILPATPKEVFAAWLDAEAMKNWLCPGSVTTTVVEVDPKVGGRFKIVMRDRGKDHIHTGEYREIIPARRLVFSWSSTLTENRPSLVTIRLKKRGRQTELVLVHEELPARESAKKHRAGWTSILEKLAQALGS